MSDSEIREKGLLDHLGVGKVADLPDVASNKMFSKAFDQRIRIAAAVIAVAVVIFVTFGMFLNWPSNREAGYMPMQPIDYSHKTHAGVLGIDCQYCHSNAATTPYATVPPLSTCMNCHEEVQPKGPDGQLKPGIKTLLDHWERKQPIVWTKVNDVADFVYFDHSRHVAKDIKCQKCHGPMETFEHMKRQFGLKMSWCIDCHSEQEQKPDGQGGFVLEQKAPTHCAACHR